MGTEYTPLSTVFQLFFPKPDDGWVAPISQQSIAHPFRNRFYKTKTKNDKINDKIKSIDQAILSEVRKNKFITISELSMTIGKSEPTIYRHVETLVAKGLLKRIGSRKAGYWETIDK